MSIFGDYFYRNLSCHYDPSYALSISFVKKSKPFTFVIRQNYIFFFNIFQGSIDETDIGANIKYPLLYRHCIVYNIVSEIRLTAHHSVLIVKQFGLQRYILQSSIYPRHDMKLRQPIYLKITGFCKRI